MLTYMMAGYSSSSGRPRKDDPQRPLIGTAFGILKKHILERNSLSGQLSRLSSTVVMPATAATAAVASTSAVEVAEVAGASQRMSMLGRP